MSNTTTTAEKVGVATFVEAIDEVIEKRIRWEQGTYAAANTELYSILGDCLDLYVAIKRSYTLPKGVNTLLEARSITYNASTSLELKLVRLVFAGSSESAVRIQNRLFGYARVIRVAADAGQTGATLAQFIADNHGIEEIRRAGKEGLSTSQKQKAQVEQARVQLIEPSDTELFANFAMPDQLQPKDGEHFSLALVRKNADGTGSIVYGTNNVTAVNTVLAIAAKALQENAVKAAEVNASKKAETAKKQNLAALTAAMADTLGTKSSTFVPQLHVPASEAELIPA